MMCLDIGEQRSVFLVCLCYCMHVVQQVQSLWFGQLVAATGLLCLCSLSPIVLDLLKILCTFIGRIERESGINKLATNPREENQTRVI